MIESSFLNPKNKASVYSFKSFRPIWSEYLFAISFWGLLAIGWPLGLFILDIVTNGSSRPFSIIFGVFYFLFSPIILLLSWVMAKYSRVVIGLQLDIWRGVNKYKTYIGVVKGKFGMKTWGPVVDEYEIELEYKREFLIDKSFYGKVKSGDQVELRYLPKSKLVIGYEIKN